MGIAHSKNVDAVERARPWLCQDSLLFCMNTYVRHLFFSPICFKLEAKGWFQKYRQGYESTMTLWPHVLGLRFVLTVGFSTAKQRVLEMSDTLLCVFPMLGMQKCPELRRTTLDRVQLLFSTSRRSRIAIRDGWRKELPLWIAEAMEERTTQADPSLR